MTNLFAGVYSGKRILLTGHTGFKGSWLTHWLLRMKASVTGYSIGIPTTPAHFTLLEDSCETIQGDILDKSALRRAFEKVQPEIVFHLAAQSLVREAYANPLLTYQTNVIGTLNVLEAAKECGSVRVFINVTTDKVYEHNPAPEGYKEDDPLGGHDPYSASKACVEILTSSFRRSFLENNSMQVASVRAGNVIGGGDWASDRLIPDLVRAARSGQATRIRYPQATRPWQHVLEPLSGYLLLASRMWTEPGKFSTAWNFGPGIHDCCPVSKVLDMATALWPAIRTSSDTSDNPYESPTLVLNSGKARGELGWHPVWDLEAALRRTMDWYRAYYEGNTTRTEKDLEEYIRAAHAQKRTWCV